MLKEEKDFKPKEGLEIPEFAKAEQETESPYDNHKGPAPNGADKELKGGSVMSKEKKSIMDKVNQVMDKINQVLEENPKLAEYVKQKLTEYANRINKVKEKDGKVTNINQLVDPPCKGLPFSKNCKECCLIFTNGRLRDKFGYQLSAEEVLCECHDICVQDVKLICVKERTVTIPIGGLDTVDGCRGGHQITGTPSLEDCRVFCAEECLETTGANRCLVVHNEVGLEVILRISASPRDILLVHRVIDRFDCNFTQFFRFPSGEGFPNNDAGRAAFRDEIKFIDGSCKTIIIEDCDIKNTCNPRVEIKLKVIDKLWKHENLLVSALMPYPENITIKQEFNSLHEIGPCLDGPCT